MRCSWLIPVRDGGAWLSEAVDSACAECGPSDEVVVVDDGSTDDAVAHLKPHARLRVIHQSGPGWSLHWRRDGRLVWGCISRVSTRTIELSRGDWLAN